MPPIASSSSFTRNRTCVPCRLRKVKCDGESPFCATCQRRQCQSDCVYAAGPSTRLLQGVLPKGEACFPCRRKKKRCDAGRPCTLCRKSERPDDCVYTERSSPSNPHRPRLRKLAPRSEDRPSFQSPDQQSSDPFLETGLVLPSGPEQQDLYPLDGLSLRPSSPHFVVPAAFSPTIIQNPFLQLSLAEVSDPLTFSLSEVSMNDLNTNFRLLFLTVCPVHGLEISSSKRQAIALGDLSHTFVHPFFVHLAHMVGCHLYQEIHGFDLLHVQAHHLQLTFEALSTMHEDDDVLTFAQANLCLFMAFVHAHSVSTATRYLKRCIKLIRKHNMRFVQLRVVDLMQEEPSVLQVLPEFSEQVQENIVFLAQILYLDSFLYLFTRPDGVGTRFTEKFERELGLTYSETQHAKSADDPYYDLERQFRSELPGIYPISFQMSPAVLRARSMLFVRDAHSLLVPCRAQRTPTIGWVQSCQNFLESLQAHVNKLSSRISELSKIEDFPGCLSVQYSSLLSSTTLAAVYYVLSLQLMFAESSQELRAKCVSALEDVLNMIEQLTPSDFLLLDSYLAVSWTRTITFISKSSRFPSPLSRLPQSAENFLTYCSSRSNVPTEIDISLDRCITRLSIHTEHFVKNKFPPNLPFVCKKLAMYSYRRKPGYPDFLRDDVRLAYGV